MYQGKRKVKHMMFPELDERPWKDNEKYCKHVIFKKVKT